MYGLESQGPDDAIDGALTEGRAAAAPAFTLEVLDRGTIPPRLSGPLGGALADGRLSLAELRGTPVVLNLWASWCTPCREEAPRLQKGWERWGPRGVAYLASTSRTCAATRVASPRSSASPTRACATPAVAWPTATARPGIPETFFVDARGRVVGHVIGVVSERELAVGARAASEGRVVGTVTGGRTFDVR